MDEGTVYAGTIARTFDILYPDAGAFKYDRDLEKEKIKKHVKRLSHALIAEPDKNVLYLNLRNYQVDEKAEFFASWIRLLHKNIKEYVNINKAKKILPKIRLKILGMNLLIHFRKLDFRY